MFENKIKFIAVNEDMLEVWPHPKPANHFMPEEYKILKRHDKGNLHAPTAKTCMPLLDAMSAGYIIPFDQDYLIDSTEKDFTVTPANRETGDVGYHSHLQVPKEWRKASSKSNVGKFINKWLIKTPPGYSCLFTQPLNRHSEDRYKIIDGVVDTDTYINTINFPIIVLEKNKQFLVKKGEPMVQVIPIKRESWKMWSGFVFEPKHNKTIRKLNSEFIDRYKKMFWNKKSFK